MAALEVPVRVSAETVVCDVVLFNPLEGHLLAMKQNRARTWNLTKGAS